jgi:hypothetical protein
MTDKTDNFRMRRRKQRILGNTSQSGLAGQKIQRRPRKNQLIESEMKHRMFGSAMGEFTVAQEGEGWIVLEDGRRVGGTLRYPFPSRKAAQRYVERELADEADTMAKGDLALSAKCRAIRETDAELWALCVNIEEKFADEDEATREAAHRAAGTYVVLIRLSMAALEADGKIYRTGNMRGGQPVFAPTKSN